MIVQKNTFGTVHQLGLVWVTTAPQNGTAEAKILDGDKAGTTTKVEVEYVEQIDRETLDKARQLATEKYGYKPEPRQQRQYPELPWLAANSGKENVRMWVEQDRGNLYLRIQEFSKNSLGVTPRSAELKLPAKGSPSWVDQVYDEKTDKPTGESLTNTRLGIVLK